MKFCRSIQCGFKIIFTGPVMRFTLCRILYQTDILKNIFTLLVCLQVFVAARGQKAQEPFTVYAYYRESTPGILRGNIGKENSKEPSPGESPMIRSWIFYATYPPSRPVKISSLSIGKKTYACRAETIADNKVFFQRPGFANSMETDTLVPPTKNTIVRLIPVEAITFVPARPLPAVRIRYKYKGITRQTSEIVIRQLPPLLLQ